MTKVISILVSLSMVLGISIAVLPQKASAAQECTQTTIGKVCKEYTDYNLTATFSKANVVKVVKEADTTSSNIYALATYVIGLINPPMGLQAAMVTAGYNTTVSKFRDAKNAGKGLKYSYTYRLYKGGTTSTSYKVLNGKWSQY